MHRLSLSFTRRLPLILQNEASECGLACLGMVSGYYGHQMDLPSLRQRFSLSLKGLTLAHLMYMASTLNMGTRALRLDLHEFRELRRPCILHWDMNHFVVLKSVHRNHLIIHDPAKGLCKVPMSEVSKHFSGVALEVWPVEGFAKKREETPVPLKRLIGNLQGLGKSIVIVFLLAICLEIFTLVAPFYMQWTIDHVIVSHDRPLLLTLAIAFALVMLLQHLTTALRGYVLLYLSTNLNIQWLSNVFSHLVQLPVDYFEKRHIGDVVSRFHAVDEIQETLTSTFFTAILDGIMGIAVVVVMWIYSPLLTAIAFIAMLLYLILRSLWYAPLRRASEEQIVHQARQQSHFLETIRGIKTVKLFGRQFTRRSRWQTLLIEQTNAGIRKQKLLLFYQLANGFLFGIEHILVIYFAAVMVLDGEFSVGALTAFIAYKQMFDSRVAQLIDQYFQLKMLSIQTGRLGDIVLTDIEKDTSLTLPMKLQENRPMQLSVTGLRFRYADYENWVLDDVSFTINAGESVALVGASGCGKTTLVNILLGILPLAEGSISVDGTPLTAEELIGLRPRIGTVMQDDVLFAGSIMDNITFFAPSPDYEWAEQCAKLAAIDEEIADMPMRYNTLIGDMGTVLSGGQQQRILLARAMYRRPNLLCLDEATSHLDVQKEKQVNTAISQMNVTRLIVAHRPETIASADRVLVLENGKISQAMSADEFMQQSREHLFV